MCNQYNGYPNYPTWNVMLWINNEYGLEDELTELVREYRNDPYTAGKDIKEYFEQYQEDAKLVPQTGMEADLFQWVWGMVDWYNIGENILDSIEWDDEDDDDEEDTDDDEGTEDKGTNTCSCCGSTDRVTFEPCQYAADVEGDYTPVWLCLNCRNSRADDI